MGKTLFEIGADEIALMELLEELASDEFHDDEMNRTIEKWFEENGENAEKKLESYGWTYKEVKERQKSLEEAAKALKAKAVTQARIAESLKERLFLYMQMQKRDSIVAGVHNFRIANNGGKLGLSIDVPTEEVPDNFVNYIPQVDTEAVREALDAGTVLTFAHLEPRGKHLRIT